MEDYVHVGMGANGKYLYIGVYDGHGGTPAAEWLQEHLHVYVDMRMGKLPGDANTMQQAMTDVFAEADAALLKHLETLGPEVLEDAGSTATVVLLAPGIAYAANLGDSSAVLWRRGQALELTTPHRVYGSGEAIADETDRVTATGAWVYDGRVCNILAVSRAFGDYEFKGKGLQTLVQAGVQRGYWPQSFADKQSFVSDPIIVVPAFTAMDLSSDDEVMVVATDGLWDVMKTADVMRFARNKLTLGQAPEEVAEALVASAIQRKSTDNVSVVVVDFKGEEHWATLRQKSGLFGGWFGQR